MENLVTYLFLGLRVIMAIALYTFLGWTVMTLWRTLDSHSKSNNKLSNQMPTISIDPANPEFPNQEFNRRTIQLGRSPQVDYLIDDATISGKHATLSYHHNHWWLEDNQSKNGTFLNEERVAEEVVVTSQDQIRLGKVELSLVIGTE